MIIPTPLLQELLEAQPHLRPRMYFKPALTALSHAMEDQVLAGDTDQPVIIASFQRERFYRQEARRYARIAARSPQVYVLAASETDFKHCSDDYETIAFDPRDALSQEWHLVVVGQQYSVCLVCREHPLLPTLQPIDLQLAQMDQARRFEGIWTFDREVSCDAACLLLERIRCYRPELKTKIAQALEQIQAARTNSGNQVDPAPFADRLVTYLQASQYKQLKAYRQIAIQERKEYLINTMTAAIRRSLDPDEILTITVRELGQTLQSQRCLIYRCKATDVTTVLKHEYVLAPELSLVGQTWPLQENPLFREVVQAQERLYLPDLPRDPRLAGFPSLRQRLEQAGMASLLMVPVLYQGRLLGMVELHLSLEQAGLGWGAAEFSLVEAIATQVGVALIQAEAYADLENLNQQLEALDRTRSNLIAITGHELRTPLSTIQVCLESLASEPDMSPELRQVMLSTALDDAERLRKLVQDFLTLSQLESGRVELNLEPLPLQECLDLALSSIRTRQPREQLPQITTEVSSELPLVRADGEWLVEVLSKLLDNACKFTDASGKITIQAERDGGQMLEVTVADTGRGIEPDRLEAVFDRFYQEEGALRRSTGGTGLGLAICRQIVTNLGGRIWAESAGKDQGSQFHFTIPSVEATPAEIEHLRREQNTSPPRRRRSRPPSLKT